MLGVSQEIAKLNYLVICGVHDLVNEWMLSHERVGDEAWFMYLHESCACWNVLGCENALAHISGHPDFDESTLHNLLWLLGLDFWLL